MKKVKYLVFMFSLLAFIWGEVSVSSAGNVKSLTSENRSESESQPNTSILSVAHKSVDREKSPQSTMYPGALRFSGLKQTTPQEINRANKLFITHRQLLL